MNTLRTLRNAMFLMLALVLPFSTKALVADSWLNCNGTGGCNQITSVGVVSGSYEGFCSITGGCTETSCRAYCGPCQWAHSACRAGNVCECYSPAF